jgi:hypothetical protein
MMHAPEMSPSLDDALRALDGASVNGVISAAQLAAVRGFLEQLDEVRNVPPMIVGRAVAELLEGAYLAGARCPDESGRMLVMSVPAFVQLSAPLAVRSPRASWLARACDVLEASVLRRPLAYMAAGCAVASLVSALVDHDAAAAAWLAFGAAGWLLLEYVVAPMFYTTKKGP